jgi:thioredoxin 1
VLEVLTAAEWEALVKDSPAVVAKFTAAVRCVGGLGSGLGGSGVPLGCPLSTTARPPHPLAPPTPTAQWCPPCKVIAPVVDALAAAHPAVAFASLDIDRPELAGVVTAHAVAAVPTFAAYKGGALAETFSGADRERLAAMVEALA